MMNDFFNFIPHYDLLIVSLVLIVFISFAFREIHKKNYNTGIILEGYFIFFSSYFWSILPHRIFFSSYLLGFFVFLSLLSTIYFSLYFFKIKKFKTIAIIISMQLLSYLFVVMITRPSQDSAYVLKIPPFSGDSHLIVHGGANSLINHHYNYSNQKYAIDIVKICSGFNFQCSFGERVVAICDGVIEEIANDSDDFTYPVVDKLRPGGNFLKLKCDDGAVAYYAHLKKSSFVIKTNETVRAGDFLALVGNSGNSTEPHLHFSVFKNNVTQQLIYKGKVLVRNSVF